MSSCATVMTKMLLFLFGLLSISFLALEFLISFLSSLGGAPKIDLPLSVFSLANSFLIVVLEEVILGKEKSYPKPIQSDADF